MAISLFCTKNSNFISPHHSTDSMYNHNISKQTHDYGLDCRHDEHSDITESLQTDSPLNSLKKSFGERLSKCAHINHNTPIDGVGTTQRMTETLNLNISGNYRSSLGRRGAASIDSISTGSRKRIENITNRITHTHTCTNDHQYVNKNIHSFEFNYETMLIEYGFEDSESTVNKIRINNLSLEQQRILKNVSVEFIQIIEQYRAQNIRLSKPRAASIENLELKVKHHQQAVYKCREELQDAIEKYKQCNRERKTLKQQQNECEDSIANKPDHNRKCFLF